MVPMAQWVCQQGSEEVGPSSSVVPNIFMISQTFVRNSIPMVPMAQWVGQQGFEAVGMGSNTSFFLHFLT